MSYAVPNLNRSVGLLAKDGNASMSELDSSLERARSLVQQAMDEYVEKRASYYADKRLLQKLLRKDHLIFALKGANSASDWLQEALNAHESSSEETVMGNSWQLILTRLSPSVGAGDLLVDKDDILWVIEMKSQTNTLNAVSTPQTLRSLRRKVIEHEQARTPGRKGVMAMIGVIRGDAKDVYERYVARTRENSDIDGFQYRYMVGAPFRAWLTGLTNPAELVSDLRESSTRLGAAREACRLRLLGELEAILSGQGLGNDIDSVIALATRMGESPET